MALTKVKNVIDITADTMADLMTMEHKEGSVQLLGYHERGDGGGGVFFWDDSKSQSEHNGGTIIAGDAVLGTWDTAGQEAWFTAPLTGTGCWVREYSGAVNVSWFGAKGDGVSDDTKPIQQAVNSIYANGKLNFNPGNTYKLNSSVQLTQVDNVTIDLQGATLEINGGYNAIQYIDAGSSEVSITLNDMIRGRSYFFCDSAVDASNFEAGDLILVKTVTPWYQDDRGSTYKGELHIVERIDGATVYVTGMLSDVYDTAVETISVQKLNKIENFSLLNGRVYNNRSLSPLGGLSLYSLVNARLSGLIIDNHSVIGLFSKYWYGGVVTECKVSRSNDSGTGYGIQTSCCTNTLIKESYFNNCRRGVDLSGTYPSHSCSVISCTSEGSGLDTDGVAMILNSGHSGFGSHAQSVGGVFKHNTVINCRYGFNSRGFDETVQNNVMKGAGRYFVASTFGSNLTIDGNVYYSTEHEQATPGSDDNANRLTAFVLKYLKDGIGSVVITNNIADRVEQSLVELYNSNISGDPFDQIDISSNTVKIVGGSANEGGSNGTFLLYNNTPATTFELRNSRIVNNNVGRVSASSAHSLLSSGIAVNTNLTTSCAIDGLPLTHSTIEVYSGGGTLSSITSTLFADIRANRTHIYGYLEFTLTGGPSLTRITNLPDMVEGERFRTPIATDSTLWYGGYSGTTTAEQELRLSDTAGTISGTIPDGTYKLALDYSFRNLVTNYY